MFFGLRDYQLEGAEFMLANPKCGLFFDCGLGKTLTVLSALQHGQNLPALIVAPLRVAKHVWPDEIEKWGFDFSWKMVHGRDKVGQLGNITDLTIINPEGLSHAQHATWPTVIVDESTYFKNAKSKRWKYLARICKQAERVVLMTGTPIAGRGHIDIWAQFGLFGETNPLGTWGSFTGRHFTFDMFNRPRLRRGHDAVINEQIAPRVLRKSVDEIDMPGLVEIDVRVDMSPAAEKRYGQMEIEENSYAPLRTIASGFEYDKHWSGEVNPVWLHENKLDALTEIAETQENILVFANFTAEIDRIAQKFGAAVIDGRTSGAAAGQLIAGWNEGCLPMLVLHPRAAGHGLNLQAGGHRVVWFSLPDSGETYQQANARVYRSGQKASTVFVHKLICQNTIDEIIAKLLQKKILNEQNLLDAVKRN
ncbi:MAG: DEAD/DEAH box helicase [Woeseiaceae bacterium]